METDSFVGHFTDKDKTGSNIYFCLKSEVIWNEKIAWIFLVCNPMPGMCWDFLVSYLRKSCVGSLVRVVC